MTRSQTPWPDYHQYHHDDQQAGDVRERVRAVEVRLENTQAQTRSDLEGVWSQMHLQNSQIVQNGDRILHQARLLADYSRALEAVNADTKARLEQNSKALKLFFAVLKWIAAVLLIAASATGKMTSETARGILGLFAG